MFHKVRNSDNTMISQVNRKISPGAREQKIICTDTKDDIRYTINRSTF